jgi:dihydroorotase
MKKILLKNARIVSADSIDEKDIIISGGEILKVCEIGEGEDLLANIIDEKGDPNGLGAEKTFSGGGRSDVAGEQVVGVVNVGADDRGGLSHWVGEECEIIDCSREGLYVLPGLIDAHVHFREPGLTSKGDFESESLAALMGGVTTIFDMPNTKPPTTTYQAFREKVKIAEEKCKCNFKLFVGAAFECEAKGKPTSKCDKNDGAKKNVELAGKKANNKEIKKVLADKKLKNFLAGIKVYMGHSTGGLGGGYELLEEILKDDELRGVPVVVHAEDQSCLDKFAGEFNAKNPASHGRARPIECSVQAVKEACHLARKYERPIHFAHVSSREELDVIDKFRGDNNKITCEVSPHHLFLNDEMYGKFGHFLKVNPPVRSKEEVSKLWEAIYDGEIDIIATDHSPHAREEKGMKDKDGRIGLGMEVSNDASCETKADAKFTMAEIPSGMPEVQTILPLLLNEVVSEKLGLKDIVRLCSAKPAEIFGLQKVGKIESGYRADLVIVDLNAEKKIRAGDLLYKCGWSNYEGRVLKGWPVKVILVGEVVN